MFLSCGPKDQSEVDYRDDVLIWASDPLDTPLAITGRITATLWVTSDQEDTDFTVKLVDVYPSGGYRMLISVSTYLDRCLDVSQLRES